jgi:hypothetical protein
MMNNFACTNFSDKCLWDIFICYNPEESSNLVANFLLPKIENELGYSCFAFERDSLGGECKYNLALTSDQFTPHLLNLGLSEIISIKMM